MGQTSRRVCREPETAFGLQFQHHLMKPNSFSKNPLCTGIFFLICKFKNVLFIIFNFRRQTIDNTAEFFKGRVSTNTETAFVFISLALLSQLRQTKEIHCDGTFQTVPRLFYQLFVVHTVAHGKV